MHQEKSANKRIAKNTIALSIRLIVTMAVSIYSSRVILANLGETDYGIYNVVGGIVGMFVFLNSSMLASTQRYLNFYLGKTDYNKLNDVFSTSVNIFVILAIIITIICEVIGIWFFKYKLSIPEDRTTAAFLVFQFSLIASFINLTSTPYNALIVANEKMGTFAYVSIYQAFGTLLIAYSISIVPMDKLVYYAMSVTLLYVSVRVFYSIYCKRNFSYVKYRLFFDWDLFKEMFAFSGWNLTTTFSIMTYTQGLTLLVNMFFSPAVNAAQSLASQVNSALLQFSYNFTMAANPQITKHYATGEITEMKKLVILCSKVSYVLMLSIALPFLMRTNYVLDIWLVETPAYTAPFLQILLGTALVASLSGPIITAVQATGDIKRFQLGITFTNLIILPFSYILFKTGSDPVAAYWCMLVVLIGTQCVRVYFYAEKFGFSKMEYFKTIALRCIILTVITYCLMFGVDKLIMNNFLGFLISCAISLIIVVGVSYMILLDEAERENVKHIFSNILNKLGYGKN